MEGHFSFMNAAFSYSPKHSLGSYTHVGLVIVIVFIGEIFFMD